MPASTRATLSSLLNIQDSETKSSLSYTIDSTNNISTVPHTPTALSLLGSEEHQSPQPSDESYADWLLADLKKPSTLFLGNPKLLTHLTEWYNEGRT